MWLWEMTIEWNAHNNFTPTLSSRLPLNPGSCFFISVFSLTSVLKSFQIIRSKNPSRKSVRKSVQVSHFVIAIVPIGSVNASPVLKTSTSSLNVFMGSMAMPHEGCLQSYIAAGRVRWPCHMTGAYNSACAAGSVR